MLGTRETREGWPLLPVETEVNGVGTQRVKMTKVLPWDGSLDFVVLVHETFIPEQNIFPLLTLFQCSTVCVLGLPTEFCSEKIPWKRLETASVIPRKTVLIPRFSEEAFPKLGTFFLGNAMKKN
jgi:hypothetical protein